MSTNIKSIKSEVKVNIVTGLGVKASEHFVSLFLKSTDKLSKRILVNECCVSAEDVIPVLANSRNVCDILFDALMPYSQFSSNLILIPCNSVHIASPYLKRIFCGSFIPIDEAVLSLLSREGRQGRFLILGTSTTVKSRMYQDALQCLGFESVIIPSSDQISFDNYIFKELVSGEMNAAHLHALRKLESRYMELLGADHVILACTELCYLVQMFSSPLACEVDSLQALHNAGIERLQILLRDDSNYAN